MCTLFHSALNTFFAWTAWPMERPEAYGPFHLTWLILALIICFVLKNDEL